MTNDRIVTAARVEEEAQDEAGLRPRAIDDYIGQDRVRENLQVSIAAAIKRSEALDHVLLYGPPGLGKTTLAYVIGHELGVGVRATSGPVLEKPGDLAGILTDLGDREVLCDAATALARARGLVPDFEGELVPRCRHDMCFSQHRIVDARVLDFLKKARRDDHGAAAGRSVA